MWQVSSSDGTRWVRWDAGQVSSQPAELADLVSGDQPVEVAVMSGEFYTPKRSGDPVAVFLRARNLVGGGPRVTGQAPAAPSAAGGDPSGRLVF